MEEIIKNIVREYNSGDEMCQRDPYGLPSSKHPFVVFTEHMGEQSICHRLRPSSYFPRPEDEDEQEPPGASICGCRWTSKLVFTLLNLKTDIVSSKVYDFYDKYFTFKQGRITNAMLYIIAFGFIRNQSEYPYDAESVVKIEEKKAVMPGLYYELPSLSNVYLIQLLKLHSPWGWYPEHSFVVYVFSDEKATVISSWQNGTEHSVPLTARDIPFEHLRAFLIELETDPSPDVEETFEYLFGVPISLGEYRTIIFDSDFPVSSSTKRSSTPGDPPAKRRRTRRGGKKRHTKRKRTKKMRNFKKTKSKHH